MPRLSAGFEARSRDLASTADPISILPNPLTAPAMIVAWLALSIKSPTAVTLAAPDRKRASSRSGAIWQRFFRYREHRGKAIRVADVEQHRLGDFTCYPAGWKINYKQRLAALDFRCRVGPFPTQGLPILRRSKQLRHARKFRTRTDPLAARCPDTRKTRSPFHSSFSRRVPRETMRRRYCVAR